MRKNFSFNNTGNSYSYSKLNPVLNLKTKDIPKKFTRRQIEFGTPRPVKEYKRFLSSSSDSWRGANIVSIFRLLLFGWQIQQFDSPYYVLLIIYYVIIYQVL